jgi:hypothetical protein
VEEIEKIKKSFVLIFQKIPLEQFAFETLREKNSSSQTFRLNKLECFYIAKFTLLTNLKTRLKMFAMYKRASLFYTKMSGE